MFFILQVEFFNGLIPNICPINNDTIFKIWNAEFLFIKPKIGCQTNQIGWLIGNNQPGMIAKLLGEQSTDGVNQKSLQFKKNGWSEYEVLQFN